MVRPVVLALAAALLVAGCDSANPNGANPSDKPRPSPLPYGYREPQGESAKAPPKAEGQELDEIVAVVWGHVLTRRRLVREVGARAEGQDEASFQKQLATARLRWAQRQLFVKAAELEGIAIPSAHLDKVMKEQIAKSVKDMSKNTGRPVTFEEYLAHEHTSEAEMRDELRDEALQSYYIAKLRSGIGHGSRPQVDFVVSPAEVRRLYREQPELFDQPQEVTFAIFQLRFVDEAVGDVTPEQAQEATRKKAQELAAAFHAGEAPEAIAKHFALDERAWRLFDKPARRFPVRVVSDWLFDPARNPHDVTVQEPAEAGGPIVIGLLDVTHAKKRTFEESYDLVVSRYREGRTIRLIHTKIIEMVQGGAVAWPESLANELVDQARQALREIDASAEYGHATFR